MMKNKIVIVFEDGLDTFKFEKRDEIRHFNPNLWDKGVMNRATHVYAPSYPKIEAAYEKAGKVVLGRKREEVVIQDEDEGSDWRELSWPKLRSKSTEFTDEPVKSKEEAIAILEKAEAEGKL